MRKVLFSAAVLLMTMMGPQVKAQFIQMTGNPVVSGNSVTYNFQYNSGGLPNSKISVWTSQQMHQQGSSWYPDSTHEWNINTTSTTNQNISITVNNLQSGTYYFNAGIFTSGMWSGSIFGDYYEQSFTIGGGGGNNNSGPVSIILGPNPWQSGIEQIAVPVSVNAPGSVCSLTVYANHETNQFFFHQYVLNSGADTVIYIQLLPNFIGTITIGAFGQDNCQNPNLGEASPIQMTIYPTDVKGVQLFSTEAHSMKIYDLTGRNLGTYPYSSTRPDGLPDALYVRHLLNKEGRIMKIEKF